MYVSWIKFIANSGVARIWRFGGKHGERGARAYMGVWGETPSGVQGQSPWSGGSGTKPPEAESSNIFLKGSFR
jgi:hypothetical protein